MSVPVVLSILTVLSQSLWSSQSFFSVFKFCMSVSNACLFCDQKSAVLLQLWWVSTAVSDVFGSCNSGVFCFVFKEAAFPVNSAPPLAGRVEREEPEPLCHSHGSTPFQLSLCAAGSRKKNRSEMRGEKNRETEWESSRWDDIMCTAAELQQHWNKGSHSHTAMPQTHKTYICCRVYTLSQIHTVYFFLKFQLLLRGFIGFHSWFILHYWAPLKKSFSL